MTKNVERVVFDRCEIAAFLHCHSEAAEAYPKGLEWSVLSGLGRGFLADTMEDQFRRMELQQIAQQPTKTP